MRIVKELNSVLSGEKFGIKCPDCGKSLPSEAFFCDECGSKLDVPDKAFPFYYLVGHRTGEKAPCPFPTSNLNKSLDRSTLQVRLNKAKRGN